MSMKIPLVITCPNSKLYNMNVTVTAEMAKNQCDDVKPYQWYHPRCGKKDKIDENGFIHCGCSGLKRFIANLRFDCGEH